jgi:hypothetical protein
MADDLFQFRWDVSEDDYKIVEVPDTVTRTLKQRVLTDGVAVGSLHSARTYYPLQNNSGLFKIFGELDLTERAICDFANRFGFLGIELTWIGLEDKPTTDSEGKPAHLVGWGEPIANWFDQIDKMKRVLCLWESARRADKAELEKSIKWTGDGEVRYEYGTPEQPPFGGTWLASKKMNLAVSALEHFRHGDVIQPAKYCVQKLINDELTVHVAPKLLWEQSWQQLGLYLAPTNLIGALWLQFARAVAGNKVYRQCRTCREWFEVSPRVARSDREFCKPSCKVSAYRSRKAEAKALAKKKISVDKIAERLKSDPKTVKKWIQEAKTKSRQPKKTAIG